MVENRYFIQVFSLLSINIKNMRKQKSRIFV